MKFEFFTCCKPITVVLALTLAGCSSTNPYQRSSRVDIPLTTLALDAQKAGAAPLAGDLHGAVATLKDQRLEWYDSLSTQARVRAVTQIGLVGLTAAALYSGLKSGVTTDGDKKRFAAAGAIGFAAYTGSDWFINTKQEAAYLEGIHGLTCSMLNIEPFRMTASTFDEMKTQQIVVTNAIDALDREVFKADSIYRYPDGSDLVHAKVRKEAKDAVSRARKTLASSEQLERQIDTSGVTLMRDGDLVFAKVASKLNAGSKGVTPPTDLPAQGLAVITKFNAVKIEPGNENTTPPKSPSPAPAPDEPQSQPSKTIASKPSSPGSKGDEQKNTEPTSSKTLTTATADELSAQLVARMTKDFEAAASKLEKERMQLLEKRKTQDDLAHQNSIAAFKSASDECTKAAGSNCAALTPGSSATNLASSTAALYAARRPLSMQLLTFDDARKTTRKNAECMSGGSDMTISPSEDATVKAGQVYDITINNAPPFPVVSVKGSASMSLIVGSLPNQFIARITVAADAKDEVNVSISDRGLTREEVKLTLEQPAAK